MSLPYQLFSCFCIGIFSGFMSGMFGIGGGSIRIPLLNFVGLPLLAAYGINLFVIPFSSMVGAFNHRDNIDYKISLYMIIGGTFGSVIGALFVGVIPSLVLAIIFVVVTFMTLFVMHMNKFLPEIAKKINPTPLNIFLGTLFLNMITGMRGGSGGSLFPPFLKVMKLDIHKAIATSLFVTIFTSISALVIYWHRGDITWMPALSVLLGSMIGSHLGSKMSLKTKPKWLEIGLSVLVLILALLVVYKSIIS
ncbi:MAG TPA: sulfite exporter TauE/SafE family protein [Candidatus Altiarchaeales archaeon]|nr:sulfite exporter TauE/SafE family protein [Candidatus Altiarchaeales archaeon]